MENNLQYKIIDADREMIDRISKMFWSNPKLIEQRYDYKMDVAVSPEHDILGYISVIDKASPLAPQMGCRFFHLLKVIPAYRRKGIATALVKNAIKQAESDGVTYIYGSSAPTEAAHGFWNSMRVCFFQYGQPDENGNYNHFFHYRTGNPVSYKALPPSFTASITDSEETRHLFDSYLREHLPEFWQKKAEQCFGIKISNEKGNMVAFSAMFESDAGKPLTIKQWNIVPYIYSRDDAVKSMLIGEARKLAHNMGISQIITGYEYNSIGNMWLDCGFTRGLPSKTKEGTPFFLSGLRAD